MSLDNPRDELTCAAVGTWVSSRVVTRPDGLRLHQDRLAIDVDEDRQVSTTHIRFRAARCGKVVKEETHVMRMRLFFREEIESLLEQAGFREVTGMAVPDANGEPQRSKWESIIRATKPEAAQ